MMMEARFCPQGLSARPAEQHLCSRVPVHDQAFRAHRDESVPSGFDRSAVGLLDFFALEFGVLIAACKAPHEGRDQDHGHNGEHPHSDVGVIQALHLTKEPQGGHDQRYTYGRRKKVTSKLSACAVARHKPHWPALRPGQYDCQAHQQEGEGRRHRHLGILAHLEQRDDSAGIGGQHKEAE